MSVNSMEKLRMNPLLFLPLPADSPVFHLRSIPPEEMWPGHVPQHEVFSPRTLLSGCPGWTTPHYRPRLPDRAPRQKGPGLSPNFPSVHALGIRFPSARLDPTVAAAKKSGDNTSPQLGRYEWIPGGVEWGVSPTPPPPGCPGWKGLPAHYPKSEMFGCGWSTHVIHHPYTPWDWNICRPLAPPLAISRQSYGRPRRVASGGHGTFPKLGLRAPNSRQPPNSCPAATRASDGTVCAPRPKTTLS